MARVLIEDCRGLRYCAFGVRQFCKRHGLDELKLIKEGVPEELLLATGDAFALKLVEKARQREKRYGLVRRK